MQTNRQKEDFKKKYAKEQTNSPLGNSSFAKPKVGQSNATKKRILLAEDGPQMRSLVSKYLEANGYLVEKCGSGSSLIEVLEKANYNETPFDLVISDVRMPGTTAIKAMDNITVGKFPPTILMSAFGDEDLRLAALKRGVISFFDKPFELDDLIEYVNNFFSNTEKQGHESLPLAHV